MRRRALTAADLLLHNWYGHHCLARRDSVISTTNLAQRAATRYKPMQTPLSKINILAKATAVACFVASAPVSVHAQVSETIDNASTAAGSVDELAGPIEVAFPADVERQPGRWTGLYELIVDKPPVLSDMKLDLNFRTYYFLRDNGTPSLIEKNQAWAAGGTVNFESGLFAEYFSVGTEAFLSAPGKRIR